MDRGAAGAPRPDLGLMVGDKTPDPAIVLVLPASRLSLAACVLFYVHRNPWCDTRAVRSGVGEWESARGAIREANRAEREAMGVGGAIGAAIQALANDGAIRLKATRTAYLCAVRTEPEPKDEAYRLLRAAREGGRGAREGTVPAVARAAGHPPFAAEASRPGGSLVVAAGEELDAALDRWRASGGLEAEGDVEAAVARLEAARRVSGRFTADVSAVPLHETERPRPLIWGYDESDNTWMFL